MHLMEYENTPLDFLMDLMQEKKKLFHRTEIKAIEVKDWPEFTLEKIWCHAINHPQLFHYIPEEWSLDEGGLPSEKAYVWAILCTQEQGFIISSMNDIRKKRNAQGDSAAVD